MNPMANLERKGQRVCEDMGRTSDVPNVWARVADVEDHSAVAPTLLESAEDLSVVFRFFLEQMPLMTAVPPVPSLVGGEMEDVGDDGQFVTGLLNVRKSMSDPRHKFAALDDHVDVPRRS